MPRTVTYQNNLFYAPVIVCDVLLLAMLILQLDYYFTFQDLASRVAAVGAYRGHMKVSYPNYTTYLVHLMFCAVLVKLNNDGCLNSAL
jgi:hypothetical protein